MNINDNDKDNKYLKKKKKKKSKSFTCLEFKLRELMFKRRRYFRF